MEAFIKIEEELNREIALVINPEDRQPQDWWTIKGNITFLLGEINSVGLSIKESLSGDAQGEWQGRLDEINRGAYATFRRLDELTKPSPKQTGTKPKQPKVARPLMNQFRWQSKWVKTIQLNQPNKLLLNQRDQLVLRLTVWKFSKLS